MGFGVGGLVCVCGGGEGGVIELGYTGGMPGTFVKDVVRSIAVIEHRRHFKAPSISGAQP